MSFERVLAVIKADLRVAARDGEQLLLTIALPLVFLVFFSLLDVVPTVDADKGDPVDFVAPGVMVLALISVAFVRTAIAFGFDRSFGAIKRYAVTPLRVGEFIGAKLTGTALLLIVQFFLIVLVALALGWRPGFHWASIPLVVLGLVVFLALGLALSSVLDGLTSLAMANALYVVLLLLSGLVFDLAVLPQWLQILAKSLPSTSLVDLLRHQLAPTLFDSPGINPWLVLTIWAASAVVAAWRLFRWH